MTFYGDYNDVKMFWSYLVFVSERHLFRNVGERTSLSENFVNRLYTTDWSKHFDYVYLFLRGLIDSRVDKFCRVSNWWVEGLNQGIFIVRHPSTYQVVYVRSILFPYLSGLENLYFIIWAGDLFTPSKLYHQVLRIETLGFSSEISKTIDGLLEITYIYFDEVQDCFFILPLPLSFGSIICSSLSCDIFWVLVVFL